MTDSEFKVLRCLAEIYSSDGMCFLSFAPLMRRTRLTRKVVRRCCRSLARKGLAEYQRGLWNDDGEVAGAGYGATIAGVETVEAVKC